MLMKSDAWSNALNVILIFSFVTDGHLLQSDMRRKVFSNNGSLEIVQVVKAQVCQHYKTQNTVKLEKTYISEISLTVF